MKLEVVVVLISLSLRKQTPIDRLKAVNMHALHQPDPDIPNQSFFLK
jgi:hypothetical protein